MYIISMVSIDSLMPVRITSKGEVSRVLKRLLTNSKLMPIKITCIRKASVLYITYPQPTLMPVRNIKEGIYIICKLSMVTLKLTVKITYKGKASTLFRS